MSGIDKRKYKERGIYRKMLKTSMDKSEKMCHILEFEWGKG